MDFALSPEEQRFQNEVREVLAREIIPEVVEEHYRLVECHGPYARELMKKLGARGWLTPTWPREHGGLGGTNMQRLIVYDELGYRGGPIFFIGASIAGPCIMLFGTEEQKRYYLPLIARGELEFALGYTEPQAGSDIASLEIRAVEEGDYFVLNGQKMFNTFCHCAEYHWLGVRTSTEGPKHKGMSLLIVDLSSPGITIRPLWTMDGMRTNEVFYDNVKVPKKNLVGEKNRGFYHILAALDLERLYISGDLHRRFENLLGFVKTVARDGQPLAKDPLIRQRMAQMAIELDVVRLLSYRTAWMLDRRKSPTSEAAMLKLYISELTQKISVVGLQVMRQCAQLAEDLFPTSEVAADMSRLYLEGLRRTIGVGTSEIQRNVIAIRGLGLPR